MTVDDKLKADAALISASSSFAHYGTDREMQLCDALRLSNALVQELLAITERYVRYDPEEYAKECNAALERAKEKVKP